MAADFFTMPIRGRPLSVRDSGVDVGKRPLGFVANHRHCPKDQAIQGARNPSDSHVVVAWIGHSETVARKHYLQTTDAHVEKAVISKPAELVASSESPIHATTTWESLGFRAPCIAWSLGQ